MKRLVGLVAMLIPIADPHTLPAEELDVKAMTFNIRLSKAKDGANGWNQRREMVRDVICRFDGDFVGLQEVWPDQLSYLRGALPQYGHIARSRDTDPGDGEAVPLFYRLDRWRLDCTQHGTFWLSDTPEEPGSKGWGNWIPRIVTWGRFTHKGSGRGVFVFNLHLDHLSERSRVRSAALLARRIAGRLHAEPVIVLGDFNSGESGGGLRQLRGEAPDAPLSLVDSYRLAHPGGAVPGTFHAFTGRSWGSKIDFILTPPTVRVLTAHILRDARDGRYPSDHFPVTAELHFPDAALSHEVRGQAGS